MRKGVEVRLGLGDRVAIASRDQIGNSPQKHVWRGRIVLLSLLGAARWRFSGKRAKASRRSGVGAGAVDGRRRRRPCCTRPSATARPRCSPRLSRCRVSLAKPFDRVEPGGRWKRDRLRPRAGLNLAVLMRGVVVDDQVQFSPGQGLAIYLIIVDADELLMPLAANHWPMIRPHS